MNYKKTTKIQTKRVKRIKESPFTQIAVVLIFIAASVMMYLYLTHYNIEGDEDWSKYALMMFLFSIIGYFGTQLINQEPLFSKKYKKFNPSTGLRATIILAASMFTQIISQAAFSFSTTEEGLYFIFAAVAEEVFFRIFLLNLFLQGKDKPKIPQIIGAVIVQAILFTAIHQNYYNNLPMLFSVFLGGIILGFFYVVWKDATANIIGHLLVNIIAVGSLLVFL
jgi:membrane protease YdiL (CAAX protease family)